MPEIIDMTGKRFGMLTVIERAPDHYTSSGRRVIYWRCKCDCGNIKDIDGSSLRHSVKSCGCINKQRKRDMGIGYMSKPLPKPITIQDRLMVGDIVRYKGKKLELIGKYDNFGRFRHENGTIECWSWWKIERMVRG